MRIEDALEQLGRQIGLALKLDDQRSCRLVFDGSTAIDIEAPEDDGTVFLHAAVGIVPATGREAVYALLLEGNLFGRGTGRAVLGVDTDLNEIILHRALDMGTTEYAAFTAALEDFLGRVKGWTERLEAMRTTVPDTAAPAWTGSPFTRV